MSGQTIILATRQHRQRAHALIDAAPESAVVNIRAATRTGESLRTDGDSAIKNGPETLRQQRPALTTAKGTFAMATSQISRPASVKQCANCGQAFARDKRNTWAYWERAKFCGSKCSGISRTDEAARIRPDIITTFAKWRDEGDGCWEWKGALDRDGYGIFTFAGRTMRAARIALELDGRPPGDQFACHHCDNPRCVRPSHLYVGTPTDNVRDMVGRGRMVIGKVAKLTPDQVREIRNASGSLATVAREYGVSAGAIGFIRNGKTWRSLV
jgi:hypothetical protein